MKLPTLNSHSSSSFSRAVPCWAAAFVSVFLGVTAVSAQSGGSGSSTGGSSSTDQSTPATGSTTGMGNTANTGNTDKTRPGTGAYGSDTSSSGSMNGSTTLKHADKRFITKAADDSMKEVALSQLAEQRATDPQVRSFAQQLVSQHSQMNTQLMELAQRKGVTLDNASSMSSGTSGAANSSMRSDMAGGSTASTGTASSGSSSMNPTSGTMNGDLNSEMTSDRHYRRLTRKSGGDFDREYVDQMVDDHESDVKMFQKAAKDAKDSEVRSFASEQLPTLQAHLQQAQTLMKSVAE